MTEQDNKHLYQLRIAFALAEETKDWEKVEKLFREIKEEWQNESIEVAKEMMKRFFAEWNDEAYQRGRKDQEAYDNCSICHKKPCKGHIYRQVEEEDLI